MEGLARRAKGSKNNGNQRPTHITEPLSMIGREHFSAAADKLTREKCDLRRIIQKHVLSIGICKRK
jgi:hypothetical protein